MSAAKRDAFKEAMKEDFSFGVVPIREHEGFQQFLLVQHKAGHWGFPKGHADPGELPIQTARREFEEETGLSLQRLHEHPTFSESYAVVKRKSGKRLWKTVTYFLGEVADGEIEHCPKEIMATAWGDATATRAKLSYQEGRSLFDRVRAYLNT